jgi:hypothetical protein
MNSSIDTLNLDIDNITNLPLMNQYDFQINNMVNKYGVNILFFVFIILAVVIYLSFFMNTQSYLSNNNGYGITSIFEKTLIILFIILISMNMLKYFLNIDVKASLINIFSKEPELDITINKLEDSLLPDDSLIQGIEKDEVFYINDNIYTYEDAKGICGAFGGRLANYFDIENAYKKGGEWCGYGWSEDQMVFYPTQKSTYEKLKKEGRQNDCGRPGINGGFIGNPDARFGVNCFGKKPKITPESQELMYEMRNVPQTLDEIKEIERKDYWKHRLNNVDIAPFNSNSWNM